MSVTHGTVHQQKPCFSTCCENYLPWCPGHSPTLPMTSLVSQPKTTAQVLNEADGVSILYLWGAHAIYILLLDNVKLLLQQGTMHQGILKQLTLQLQRPLRPL